MAKQQKENDSTNSVIIDTCLNILNQNNIIVYPSNEETHNDTIFYIKKLDERKPGKSIFAVYGPSHGYGLKIITTDVYISGYELLPNTQSKLRQLWHESDIKSYKQKEMRKKIATENCRASLVATQYHLQSFIDKTK